MRLRRVVITGFKTFARRSEVVLEPGITAIVGPNGSGKSNLVDAIRWALGETNARELRGSRMDEVIYSGGSGRARMGFAEVELVLDNEDGRLAVEDVEVAVGRRVVRHGDSDFRLNGARVRLRDLERVLGTTGLTQSGYAVVAQNDIDAIIGATPVQRRALIEQAAGVRSLRAACEDALHRIGQAETTLRRFEDLLAETEPRLAELASQAEVARTQRELSDQLGQLRGSLAREAWRAARAQLRQGRRRLDAAEGRLEAAATAEAAFAGRLAEHRAQLDERRSGRDAAVGRLEGARLSAERAAGDHRRSVDRAHAAVLARASAAAELRASGAEAADRQADLDALTADDGSAPAAAADLQRRREEAERQHATAVVEQERAEASVAGSETALRAAEEERADADAARLRTATQLRLFDEAVEALRARVGMLEVSVHGRSDQAAAVAAERDAAAVAAAAATAARAASDAALGVAQRRLAAAQETLDAARQLARAALGRAAALRGQVEGALGGRGALAAAVANGDVAARRLVDCLDVAAAEDVPAVEAALEPSLGAWVVADLEQAAAVLDPSSAREELLRAGNAAEQAAAAADGARPALSVVRAVPGAGAALAHCLAGAWLVADRAAAERVVDAVGGRAILPDGTVVSTAGIRGGGRPGRTLELAAHEREAAAAADRAMAAEHAGEAERSAAAARLAAAEAADREAIDQHQAARLGAVEVGALASAAAEALAAESRQLQAARAELSARDQERGTLAGGGAGVASRLVAADAAVLALRAATQSLRLRLVSARAAAVDAAAALRAIEVAEGRLAAELAERRRRIEVVRTAVQAADARRTAAAARVLAAELDVLGALARGHAARAAMAAGAASVAGAAEALETSAPGVAEAEAAVALLEAERSEVAVVLARAADERAAGALEVAAAEERVGDLAEAVRGDEDDEGPEPEAGDAERAEREIVRLERRISALGPVNALAPEEHDRLAVRVAALRAGRDDLGSACADVRAIAAHLTTAIDSRFEAVFGAVSMHFHELFAELFPGGRATLRHEQPDRPVEDGPGSIATAQPGVEILAQPPGKRLQPLSLFSGGERALTALAVILALQQVNPSPFYVFDEVDAPLDDSNVLRFTRLLTRLAVSQQFIVVTHNHITMAAADALHGVTSDGDGVSSVIGVRFDAGRREVVPEGHVLGVRQSTIRAAV